MRQGDGMKGWQASFGWMALGALVVAAAGLAWTTRLPPQPVAGRQGSAAAGAPQAAAQAPAAASPQQVAQVASSPPSACGSDPGIPPGRRGDGQFRLQAALDSADTPPASAFLSVAQEAAQQGRPRDAEVALIAACRLTERSAPAPSAPLSRVMNLLGQHYVSLAGAQPDGELRESLLARGRDLLDASVRGYTAALGAGSSRARDAAERLAAVQSQGRATPGEVWDRGATAEEPAGAHDSPCGGAAAAIACRDPELQRMEQDLQRLRAQAESVSRDPAGLQRRAAQAQARRDACASRDCLLHWYAQRRSELLGEFSARRARAG
jgi:hypothetical protein